MSTNGNSNGYQKVPSVEGYAEENGNGYHADGDDTFATKKKWMVGILIAILACFGIFYVASDAAAGSSSTAHVEKVLSGDSSTVHVNEDGKLKLFDDLST